MKKTKPKKIKVIPYEASLKCSGHFVTSLGSSLRECIQNLKPDRPLKGISVLSIKHGEEIKERVLSYQQTFRFFNGNKIMREVAIKNTSILFGNL